MPQRSGATMRMVMATGLAPALLLERVTVARGADAIGSPTGCASYGDGGGIAATAAASTSAESPARPITRPRMTSIVSEHAHDRNEVSRTLLKLCDFSFKIARREESGPSGPSGIEGVKGDHLE